MTPYEHAKKVVKNRQYAIIDDVMLDTTTASRIVWVYEHTSNSNKAKLNHMSLQNCAFACLKTLEMLAKRRGSKT